MLIKNPKEGFAGKKKEADTKQELLIYRHCCIGNGRSEMVLGGTFPDILPPPTNTRGGLFHGQREPYIFV